MANLTASTVLKSEYQIKFLWEKKLVRGYSGCIINATNSISRERIYADILKTISPGTSKKHLVPYATNMEIIKMWW